MGAGADLDRVFQVDVMPRESARGSYLTLPSDIDELHQLVRPADAPWSCWIRC
jgi:hypothetical protein